VTVNPYCDRICNIPQPTTGLEGKFSLRLTAAMALANIETADPAMFSDAVVNGPELLALRDRVTVGFDPAIGQGCASIKVARKDSGAELFTEYNAARPWTDLNAQQTRLQAKFERLAAPVLGEEQTLQLADCVEALEALQTLEPLFVLAST
jgi:hypothetical protein